MLPYSSVHSQRGSWIHVKKTSTYQKTNLGLFISCFILLIFVLSNWRGNVRLRSSVSALEGQLKTAKIALSQEQVRVKDRKLEYDQLEASCSQTQKRLMEVTNQINKKDADLRKKDSVIKMLVDEKEAVAQQNQERFREHQQHLDMLQRSVTSGDEAIAAYERKIEQMETAYRNRERDWVDLSKSWREYEEDLQDHITKLTTVVESLSRELHRTIKVEELAASSSSSSSSTGHNGARGEVHHPADIIPKFRPDSDFEHINVQIPKHDHPDFHALRAASAVGGDIDSSAGGSHDAGSRISDLFADESGSHGRIDTDDHAIKVISGRRETVSSVPGGSTTPTVHPIAGDALIRGGARDNTESSIAHANERPSLPLPSSQGGSSSSSGSGSNIRTTAATYDRHSLLDGGRGAASGGSGSGLSDDDVDRLMEVLRRRRTPTPSFKFDHILADDRHAEKAVDEHHLGAGEGQANHDGARPHAVGGGGSSEGRNDGAFEGKEGGVKGGEGAGHAGASDGRDGHESRHPHEHQADEGHQQAGGFNDGHAGGHGEGHGDAAGQTEAEGTDHVAPDDFHRHHDDSYSLHHDIHYHYDPYDPLDHYWVQDGQGDVPVRQ